MTELFQILTIAADVLIFLFVAYYFYRFRARERDLDEKSGKMDREYHEVLNTALARERKILEDATKEATQILSNAQYVSDTSKQAVAQALDSITKNIQGQAGNIAQGFTENYQASLKTLSDQSLSNLNAITKNLEADLQNQLKEFHEKMLPGLEKQLEDYKQARIKHIEDTVNRVIGEVSQDVLGKAISMTDHENLVIQSLDKAKKEGVFG